MITAAYWDDVDAAWEDRPQLPASRRLGPVRGGAFAAAVLLGVRVALEPSAGDEIVVEVDVDRPAGPVDGVVLHFDAASPKRTVAVLCAGCV